MNIKERYYLCNVIYSCIFEDYQDDARAIKAASKTEEAVTRLFNVYPMDCYKHFDPDRILPGGDAQ